MKIYRIKYTLASGAGDTIVLTKKQEFAASDGAASKRCTELKKDFKDTLDDKPEREAIDIPTDKTGLIEWLNKNAVVAGVVTE